MDDAVRIGHSEFMALLGGAKAPIHVLTTSWTAWFGEVADIVPSLPDHCEVDGAEDIGNIETGAMVIAIRRAIEWMCVAGKDHIRIPYQRISDS